MKWIPCYMHAYECYMVNKDTFDVRNIVSYVYLLPLNGCVNGL